MLEGYNVCVLDLETKASASDCRYCGKAKQEHLGHTPYCPPGGAGPMARFTPIGWDNHAALGLSIGCIYWYAKDRYTFFDQHTLEATMRYLVQIQPLIVSFNGKQFDCPLMATLFPGYEGGTQLQYYGALQVYQAWGDLYRSSYDLLDQISRADPSRKFEHGLNSLGAISVANGFGAKEMDGAEAPRRWAEGCYAEVVTYCLSDVWKTRKLFERILWHGSLLRGDDLPIVLPAPDLTPYRPQEVP